MGYRALMLLTLIGVGSGAQNVSPGVSPETVQVYQAFLASYHADTKAVLRVAQDTAAYRPDRSEYRDCLRGFTPDATARTPHRLTAEALALPWVELVDPKAYKTKNMRALEGHGASVRESVTEAVDAGLIYLSEVKFDRTHRLAAFHFAFRCGPMCGQDGDVVYARRANGWVQLDRDCPYGDS